MFDNDRDPWYQRCKQWAASTERFLDVACLQQILKDTHVSEILVVIVHVNRRHFPDG